MWNLLISTVIGDQNYLLLQATIKNLSKYIGKYGSFAATAAITSTAQAGRTLDVCMEPDRFAANLFRGDDLWWAGFIDKANLVQERNSLSLDLQGTVFDAYPERRELRSTGGYSQVEQVEIVRDLWIKIQQGPGCGLGVTVPASSPTGQKRDLSWKDDQSRKYASAMSEVANSLNGFEYMIDVAGTRDARSRTLRIGYPSIGSQQRKTFTMPGQIKHHSISIDALSAPNSWRTRGEAPAGSSGVATPAPMSDVFQDDAALAAGHVRRDKTVQRDGVSLKATLNNQAKFYRDTRSKPISVPDVTVGIEDVEPDMLGALVTLRIRTLLHPDGPNGEPGLQQQARCIGLEVTPESRGAPSEVKLIFEEAESLEG